MLFTLHIYAALTRFNEANVIEGRNYITELFPARCLYNNIRYDGYYL